MLRMQIDRDAAIVYKRSPAKRATPTDPSLTREPEPGVKLLYDENGIFVAVKIDSAQEIQLPYGEFYLKEKAV